MNKKSGNSGAYEQAYFDYHMQKFSSLEIVHKEIVRIQY